VGSESVAQISNNLLYCAMAVYAGAMYCYAAELAFGLAFRGVGHLDPTVGECEERRAAAASDDRLQVEEVAREVSGLHLLRLRVHLVSPAAPLVPRPEAALYPG